MLGVVVVVVVAACSVCQSISRMEQPIHSLSPPMIESTWLSGKAMNDHWMASRSYSACSILKTKRLNCCCSVSVIVGGIGDGVGGGLFVNKKIVRWTAAAASLLSLFV